MGVDMFPVMTTRGVGMYRGWKVGVCQGVGVGIPWDQENQKKTVTYVAQQTNTI